MHSLYITQAHNHTICTEVSLCLFSLFRLFGRIYICPHLHAHISLEQRTKLHLFGWFTYTITHAYLQSVNGLEWEQFKCVRVRSHVEHAHVAGKPRLAGRSVCPCIQDLPLNDGRFRDILRFNWIIISGVDVGAAAVMATMVVVGGGGGFVVVAIITAGTNKHAVRLQCPTKPDRSQSLYVFRERLPTHTHTHVCWRRGGLAGWRRYCWMVDGNWRDDVCNFEHRQRSCTRLFD